MHPDLRSPFSKYQPAHCPLIFAWCRLSFLFYDIDPRKPRKFFLPIFQPPGKVTSAIQSDGEFSLICQGINCWPKFPNYLGETWSLLHIQLEKMSHQVQEGNLSSAASPQKSSEVKWTPRQPSPKNQSEAKWAADSKRTEVSSASLQENRSRAKWAPLPRRRIEAKWAPPEANRSGAKWVQLQRIEIKQSGFLEAKQSEFSGSIRESKRKKVSSAALPENWKEAKGVPRLNRRIEAKRAKRAALPENQSKAKWGLWLRRRIETKWAPKTAGSMQQKP